jgi:hypothetical protein
MSEGNYVVVLPNQEFFAVKVAYIRPEATGIQHFIQPYRTNAGVGVHLVDCPFGWVTFNDS